MPRFSGTELTGWLAGRDVKSAVAQLLEAVPGTDLITRGAASPRSKP